MESLVTRAFWAGKRVLLTGHTGFKGCWMAMVLRWMGAEVHGLALPPDTSPDLFTMLSLDRSAASHVFDIRDRARLNSLLQGLEVDVVVHMAAQSLVRRSYRMPFETFDVNVRGTLNLLDALHQAAKYPPTLVITSDKVYRNDNSGTAFRETDPLGGDDPYSASKAACEIAVHAFAAAVRSRLASARGGNVIGGGDYAEDRLFPDAVRAYLSRKPLVLRHPDATRPWQHVLDTVFGYLKYAEMLADTSWDAPAALNFGPAGPVLSVGQALEIFAEALGTPIECTVPDTPGPAEKTALALNVSETRKRLGFANLLPQPEAIRWAGEWYRRVHAGENARTVTEEQIERYSSRSRDRVPCAS
jgi:CDP-glucose 4,6-dehydratase